MGGKLKRRKKYIGSKMGSFVSSVVGYVTEWKVSVPIAIFLLVVCFFAIRRYRGSAGGKKDDGVPSKLKDTKEDDSGDKCPGKGNMHTMLHFADSGQQASKNPPASDCQG